MNYGLNCALALLLGMSANVSYASHLLGEVESLYRNADTIQMNAVKTLKVKLLGSEKKSEGLISLKKGGLFRWEIQRPEHSLVLIDGKSVWLVDYPSNEDQKTVVLKASNPKQSQPPAVVTFLMGSGRMSDQYKVLKEKKLSDGLVEIQLRSRAKDEQVKSLMLDVDKDKRVKRVSFEDGLGNVTDIDFRDVEFNKKLDDGLFKFTPPKDAEITVVH